MILCGFYVKVTKKWRRYVGIVGNRRKIMAILPGNTHMYEYEKILAFSNGFCGFFLWKNTR